MFFFFFLLRKICLIYNVFYLACKDNLDSFINMEPETGFGTVLSLKQFVNKFYRSKVNQTSSPQPQTSPHAVE